MNIEVRTPSDVAPQIITAGHTAPRRVRPAVSSDLQTLIELGRRSWLSAFAQTAPFAVIAWWIANDRFTAHYERHWTDMRVCEEGDQIIGLVQPTGSEINGLWVRPDRQGTGAGTLLLAAGEQLIHGRGHDAVWLTCSGWNQPALRFCIGRGYVETGRSHHVHESGVEVEDVRMERRLR